MRFHALSIAIILSATIVSPTVAGDDFGDALSFPPNSLHEFDELLPPAAPSDFGSSDTDGVPRSSLLRPFVGNVALTNRVDMDAAFEMQENLDSTVPASTVGFGHHRIAAGCDGSACNGGCDACETCVSHDHVQLPSSTFLQYFRSNKCNTHVWDGYQQKCNDSRKHLMGDCDCAMKSRRGCRLGSAFGSCGEILPPMPRPACGRKTCDAAPCDSIGCDSVGCDAIGCDGSNCPSCTH